MAAKVTKTRYTLAGALLSVFAGIAASFFLGSRADGRAFRCIPSCRGGRNRYASDQRRTGNDI